MTKKSKSHRAPTAKEVFVCSHPEVIAARQAEAAAWVAYEAAEAEHDRLCDLARDAEERAAAAFSAK